MRYPKGTCCWCGKPSTKENKAYCAEHREAKLAYTRLNREKGVAYTRERRRKLKAQGRCQDCTNPTTDGQSRCDMHLKLGRDQHFARYGKALWRRRDERIAQETRFQLRELRRTFVDPSRWTEAKDWIEQHIDLWLDKEDNVLYKYVPVSNWTRFAVTEGQVDEMEVERADG